MKAIIQDLNYEEIKRLTADCGQPAFRAKQLYEGITQGKDISQISTLPAPFKQRLLADFEDCALSILKEFTGADGTKKFLFALADGNDYDIGTAGANGFADTALELFLSHVSLFAVNKNA